MVYRIQPKRTSRVCFILRTSLRFLFWMLLAASLLLLLLDAPWRTMLVVAPLLLLAAFYFGWLNSREWQKLDLFTPQPTEYFLTIVEEGLVVESPSKGFAVSLPRAGLGFRRRGSLLFITSHGVLRSLLSLNGLEETRCQSLLADLQTLARPLMPAAPATTPQADALPPLPPATLAPPVPLAESERLTFSNTPEQRREFMNLAHRPDVLRCTTLMVVLAFAGFYAGRELGAGNERLWSALLFFTLGAAYLLRRIVRPGRRMPFIPGSSSYRCTKSEFFEGLSDGAWGRFRLPEAGQGYLVRLVHAWCLHKGKGLPVMLVDAEGEAPPAALAHYPVKAMPRNRLRGVLAVLLLLAGCVCGSLYAPRTSQASRDFRALLPEPDTAALRAYVTEHYVQAQLLRDPDLFSYEDEESGEMLHHLYFMDLSPHPEGGEDAGGHLAWVHCVTFSPSGRQKYVICKPVYWCPCEDCLHHTLEELMQPHEEENATP